MIRFAHLREALSREFLLMQGRNQVTIRVESRRDATERTFHVIRVRVGRKTQ